MTTKFAENVLDSTNAFESVDRRRSRCWPACRPARSPPRAQSAESKGLEGWRFTLQAPELHPRGDLSGRRGVREQFYRAFAARATEAERDNRPLIVPHSGTAAREGRLLGFRDFADFVLDDRMAHTGDRAMAFLDGSESQDRVRFREGKRELLEAVRRRRERSEPWDVGYYAEKQRAGALRFRRRGAAALLPAGARGRRACSRWSSGSTAST